MSESSKETGSAGEMTLEELRALSVSERTDYLEQLAHRQGLHTAPGPRLESELLSSMIEKVQPGLWDADTCTRTLWAYYFKAPILLARLLQLFHPHLLEPGHGPLRVLYLGADQTEVMDDGRWFPLAWRLMGLPYEGLEITAVGPGLAEKEGWQESEWKDRVERLPAVTDSCPGRLEDACTTFEMSFGWERLFDIVVMHHPGFVANSREWTDDLAWADLAGFADLPIIGTSFDDTDLPFDRVGLAMSGRIIDQVYWNPMGHVSPGGDAQDEFGTRLRWGNVLWSTCKDPNVREDGISPSQRKAMEWIRKYHVTLFSNPTPLQAWTVWLYTCPMQFDDLHRWVCVTDDIRITCNTGCVTAYGVELEATELTRRVVETSSLDQRLSIYPELMKELGGRLDPAAVERYCVGRGRVRLPK